MSFYHGEDGVVEQSLELIQGLLSLFLFLFSSCSHPLHCLSISRRVLVLFAPCRCLPTWHIENTTRSFRHFAFHNGVSFHDIGVQGFSGFSSWLEGFSSLDSGTTKTTFFFCLFHAKIRFFSCLFLSTLRNLGWNRSRGASGGMEGVVLCHMGVEMEQRYRHAHIYLLLR